MNCACGKPLHYQNQATKELVDWLSDRLGVEIEVQIGNRRYSVQRHFIALHGLNGCEAEMLADCGVIRRLCDALR